jgi:hypothetical protein
MKEEFILETLVPFYQTTRLQTQKYINFVSCMSPRRSPSSQMLRLSSTPLARQAILNDGVYRFMKRLIHFRDNGRRFHVTMNADGFRSWDVWKQRGDHRSAIRAAAVRRDIW